jgi:hypothetical protein
VDISVLLLFGKFSLFGQALPFPSGATLLLNSQKHLMEGRADSGMMLPLFLTPIDKF